MPTQLIKREELTNTIQQLLMIEKEAAEVQERIITALSEGQIKSDLEKDLAKRKDYIAGLEAGFVPLDMGGFIRTDTKDKWRRSNVKAALAGMPEEAKQAWEEAKRLGIFKSFSISTGGDPILVGNLGGARFFIATWICVTGGAYIGFRFASSIKEV